MYISSTYFILEGVFITTREDIRMSFKQILVTVQKSKMAGIELAILTRENNFPWPFFITRGENLTELKLTQAEANYLAKNLVSSGYTGQLEDNCNGKQ